MIQLIDHRKFFSQNGVRGLAWYFLRLGASGFGGPAVLVERMEADLVRRRRWFAAEDFSAGLALAQLAPGPLAAQLASYFGWKRHGAVGALLTTAAFVAPSLLMVVVIAAVYARNESLPILHAAFYGAGAAVIPIIARASWRLARRSFGGRPELWTLASVNALLVAMTGRESLLVIAASGLAMIAAVRARDFLAVAVPPVTLLVFFAKAGIVVFGSGLAILPYLRDGAVLHHHWLTERQFVDAVAVALLTPGPAVITVAFVGYLVGGVTGSLLAAVGVFGPMMVVVMLFASRFDRIVRHRAAVDGVAGVTAAAIGSLVGGVVLLGMRALVDLPTVSIALATALVVLLLPRIPQPLVLLAAGVGGVLLARGS